MANSTPMVSVIIPVFNEAVNLRRFYPKLVEQLDSTGLDYEIIYVDDGSRDHSLAAIRELSGANPKVRYLAFSRNFGKEAATSAGLAVAKGDAAVMQDADGQHPLELLSEFIAKWQGGAEVVVGVRIANQHEGFVKRYGSKVFYRILGHLTDGRAVAGATDFRLIDRKVIDAFNGLTERNRITRGIIDWLGFRQEFIKFKANAREEGVAGYDFGKLVRLALYAFVSQSTKPLLWTGVLGISVMLISALLGAFMFTETYLMRDALGLHLSGTAMLATFLSFLVGVVLLCQGLMALYIESIHSETQNRPLYVIAEEG